MFIKSIILVLGVGTIPGNCETESIKYPALPLWYQWSASKTVASEAGNETQQDPWQNVWILPGQPNWPKPEVYPPNITEQVGVESLDIKTNRDKPSRAPRPPRTRKTRRPKTTTELTTTTTEEPTTTTTPAIETSTRKPRPTWKPEEPETSKKPRPTRSMDEPTTRKPWPTKITEAPETTRKPWTKPTRTTQEPETTKKPWTKPTKITTRKPWTKPSKSTEAPTRRPCPSRLCPTVPHTTLSPLDAISISVQRFCDTFGRGEYANPLTEFMDCTSYIRCTDGSGSRKGSIYTCPGSTLYNPDERLCVESGYTCPSGPRLLIQ